MSRKIPIAEFVHALSDTMSMTTLQLCEWLENNQNDPHMITHANYVWSKEKERVVILTI